MMAKPLANHVIARRTQAPRAPTRTHSKSVLTFRTFAARYSSIDTFVKVTGKTSSCLPCVCVEIFVTAAERKDFKVRLRQRKRGPTAGATTVRSNVHLFGSFTIGRVGFQEKHVALCALLMGACARLGGMPQSVARSPSGRLQTKPGRTGFPPSPQRDGVRIIN